LKSVPLGLGVVAFVVFAAVSIAYAFAIYMTAMIISVVAVVTGPVFLALAAVPMTRRFAAGWFGVLVGGCTTQLMALAVIKLLTGTEAKMLQQTVIPAASTNNSIDLLWGLVQAAILLALCAAVIKKIPDIARAIAHGVYHGAAGINAATFGMARQVTQAAAGGGARGARAAATGAKWLAGGPPGAGGAPWRPTTPVGRSLSRGDR
jgi:type IV secretory pathway VirB6-like protein